jgi:hypothetical protein
MPAGKLKNEIMAVGRYDERRSQAHRDAPTTVCGRGNLHECYDLTMPNWRDNAEGFTGSIAAQVGATEAAAFAIDPAYADVRRFKLLAHLRPDRSDDFTRSRAIAAFKEILARCVEQAKDGIFEIDGTAEAAESQFCLVLLTRQESAVLDVITMIVRGQIADVEAALTRARRTASASGW